MSMNRRRFLQAAGAGASLGVTGASWAFHDDGLPLMQPSYGDIVGLEILGFNDMRLPGQPRAEGWDQTYEFRVVDQRRAGLLTAETAEWGGPSSMSPIRGGCAWSGASHICLPHNRHWCHRSPPTTRSTSTSRAATFWASSEAGLLKPGMSAIRARLSDWLPTSLPTYIRPWLRRSTACGFTRIRAADSHLPPSGRTDSSLKSSRFVTSWTLVTRRTKRGAGIRSCERPKMKWRSGPGGPLNTHRAAVT